MNDGAIMSLKGTTPVDEETILSKYPRFTPKQGFSPDDGDPKNHVRVERPEDHRKINPQDYAAMLAEAPAGPTTIREHVDRALQDQKDIYDSELAAAVVDERERCAKIAEGTGGSYGKRIAAEIRGESVTSATASVEG